MASDFTWFTEITSRSASPQPGSSAATLSTIPVQRPTAVTQPVDVKVEPAAPQKFVFTNNVNKFVFNYYGN